MERIVTMKISSVKLANFQLVLSRCLEIKDLTNREKRDLNQESGYLHLCLAFTIKFLSDCGQIIEPQLNYL